MALMSLLKKLPLEENDIQSLIPLLAPDFNPQAAEQQAPVYAPDGAARTQATVSGAPVPYMQPMGGDTPQNTGATIPMLDAGVVNGNETANMHPDSPYLARPLATAPAPEPTQIGNGLTSDALQAPVQTPPPATQADAAEAEAARPAIPKLPSQITQDKIQEIHDKDYSKAKYDENGNLVKPAGKDRDKKWSLGEKLMGIGFGILEGLGRGEGLAGGAVRAVGYGTDRNFGEKQRDQADMNKYLPQLKEQQTQEGNQANYELKQEQVANSQNEQLAREAEARRRTTQMYIDRLNDQEKQTWNEYQFAYGGKPAYKKDAPENAAQVARFQKMGLPIYDKPANQEWDVAPNGDVFDKYTGQKLPGVNFARPKQISMSELPDTLFGVMSDTEINDAARSKVGPLPEGRRIRPEVAAKMTQFQKDGKFDEDAYIAAMSSSDAKDRPGIGFSELYENMPSSYEQRLAGERKRLRDSQKTHAIEAARIKSTLAQGWTPESNATPASANDIIHVWRKIMGLDPPDQQGEKTPSLKDRADVLKKFYANLKYFKVQ